MLHNRFLYMISRTGMALGALSILGFFAAAKAEDPLPSHNKPAVFTFAPQALTSQAPIAPDVPFLDEDGKPRTLRDFSHPLIIVNFWATWCVPCVAEMPSLDRLAALMDKDVKVIALSQDRDGEVAVDSFYARLKIKNLSVYLDPKGSVRRALGISALPTTVIYTRHGREIGRLEGVAAWDSPAVMEFLKKLAVE
ncbi:MAG: TlpA disulfide reductase family protein [Alphaproteobacteria bacterium]